MPFNNSTIGFTFQKMICDKFNITPKSSVAQHYFASNYESKLDLYCKDVIDEIFNELKLCVEECVSFCENEDGSPISYNFILNNGKSLSIRTNLSGTKISPRELGQAGYSTLTKYFGNIYGDSINNKEKIKKLFLNYIDIILPVYIDKLFDADYVVWIYQERNMFKYFIISREEYSEFVMLDRKDLSFTRSIDNWNNSNTLKYKGKSIAEIQVFEDRGLIFRFFIKNLIQFI